MKYNIDQKSVTTRFTVGEIKVKNVYLNDENLIIKTNTFNLPKVFDLCLFNYEDKRIIPISFSFDVKENVIINMEEFRVLEEDIKGVWHIGFRSSYKNNVIIEAISLEACYQSPEVIIDLFKYELEGAIYHSGIYISADGDLIYCQLTELLYKIATRQHIKENYVINQMIFEDSYCEFKLEDIEYSLQSIKNVVLTNRKTDERVLLKAQLIDNKIRCYYPPLEFSNGRWDVSLELFPENLFVNGRLSFDSSHDINKSIKYFELDSEDAILVYSTIKKNITLLKGKKYNVFREKNHVKLELINLNKKRNSYKLTIDVSNASNLKIEKVILKLRNKELVKTIEVPEIFTKKINDTRSQVIANFKMDWKEYRPLYWDPMLEVIDQDGINELMRINNTSHKLKMKLDEDYFKWSLFSKDKMLYPYLTFNNNVAFIMREKEKHENMINKLKEIFAYFSFLLTRGKIYKDKSVWLGFEKFSQTAQDNGYAFFNYVDENKLHENFYYIIDSTSPDYKYIKNKNRNVIKFMSFKYFYLIFAANLLISSETKRHAYNIRVRSGKINQTLNNKKSVFLQHGVTGLKKSDVFKKKKGRGNFDLVIATSEHEKDIIRENWNYSNEEIAVTGFSRWDLLEDKSQNRSLKKIFVMPTWRSWIEGMPKSDFKQSDYFSKYYSMLNSEELNFILSKNNLELVFFLHPKFKEYASEFIDNNNGLDNIKIKDFLDIKVNEELMEASLLISDYSSVTWDMYYLNKPVIFFQFDYNKYEEYEGSYIDMDRDLFGDRVENVEELLHELRYYIKNDFNLKPHFSQLRQEYFKYLDHNNSKRIFNEINTRLGLGD
ncbi:hypothetical protein BME96_16455 [Virgibacillus halodenitrificans]|uniref:CDP-glycerol glycerophosphotransferase n=1 Tax=Virgibacillus halodenitrificans TaxID=1482 RepID=A0AAC9J207_VIRHA|nr:CDP-glycerol glycerophosphotransferase family protein [Virgibacillus halodenitrificans]APC49682.1 hypothetical protein BME96_16455 [Virgibacillus halodenitrificans]